MSCRTTSIGTAINLNEEVIALDIIHECAENNISALWNEGSGTVGWIKHHSRVSESGNITCCREVRALRDNRWNSLFNLWSTRINWVHRP